MKQRRRIDDDVIIAVRLSPKVPEEARALRILNTLLAMRQTKRQIITRALCALDGQPIPTTLDAVAERIENLHKLVQELAASGISAQLSPAAKKKANASLGGLAKVFGED
jgi:hypothetical protein